MPGKKKSQTPNKAAAEKPQTVTPKEKPASRFPIVGLGASAGGLEALKTFFSEVSENSGMAYVVIIHMARKQPSMLAELLQKTTAIPVSSAEDGQTIEPDHVYVIPPDKEITVYKGKIQLLDVLAKRGSHPIDLFLKSLAQDQGSYAAAVILSGTGTDGSTGLKEIKACDGLVMIQSEASAAYDGMPRSAITTGMGDLVLPPEEMPEKLIQYFAHMNTIPKTETFDSGRTGDKYDWLDKIFAILRTQVGHDFSVYKTNTLLRRISRRMGLNRIDGYDTYLRFMRENPAEVNALFREMLIGVTSFFRDPESFQALKKICLPDLLRHKTEDTAFRIWVPGCSTGEEVYTLAMIFRECLDNSRKRIQLQMFGTDIDSEAIDKAREGLYPASIAGDVGPERLERFFSREGVFFRIRKEIRDCAVFSAQNIIKDPPFSRLDLLCCRNLLIYLDGEAQQKILPLFHYTLNPDGIMMLGSSESVGEFSKMFEPLDKKWKIFRRREIPITMRPQIYFPSGPLNEGPASPTAAVGTVPPKINLTQIAQKAILDQLTPTAILITAEGEILHVQGRTGKYLETPSGPPTQNILNLAREGLRIELSTAIRSARTSPKKVVRKKIPVQTDGDIQMINLYVRPQHTPKELAGRFLVVFEDTEDRMPSSEGSEKPWNTEPETARIAELEKELLITRESHQTAIEELESSNEELKSTNEELQSANEELQSTNEELESSKEELQSLNEELQTVNSELQNKLEELSAAHDDMHNLLNSTEIATIFVDSHLCIRRFTQEATRIVNLIQTDIGRPLRHVASNLTYDRMIDDLENVMGNLFPREAEVRTAEGIWYNMRIIPYRTTDNRIDGAVLTFSLIEVQKKEQASLIRGEHALQLARAVFDMKPDPATVLDENGKMVIANAALSEMLNIPKEDIEGTDILDMENRIPEPANLKSALKNALQQNTDFKTGPFEMETPAGRQRYLILGEIIREEGELPYRILLRFVGESKGDENA